MSNQYRMTDLGNASRFVDLYRGKVRYCPVFKKWLFWDGTRWILAEADSVTELAKSVPRHMYSEAAKTKNDDYRGNLVTHARRLECESRLNGMVSLAKSDPAISIRPKQLDQDPWLLNVQNGTIDLRSGNIREHSPSDYITKLAPVTYDPNAECPFWLGFIKRVLNGDPKLIAYLQRALGYSLTGLTTEQVLFVLFGLGANGKSTLGETWRGLLGDYAAVSPTETLLVRKGESIPNDIARLVGKRFVLAIETEDGRRLASARVKQLTGGDTVTGRFLHQEFFEYRPEFKIFLLANHRPIIRDTTHSIWRRIHVVPFDVQLSEEERDKDLPEKLQSELPGILNWGIEGCLKWQRDGLQAPDCVKAANATYRREMDLLQSFLDEICTIGMDLRINSSELFGHYTDWAKTNREMAVSRTEFRQRLIEKGFESKRSGPKGSFEWHGIAV